MSGVLKQEDTRSRFNNDIYESVNKNDKLLNFSNIAEKNKKLFGGTLFEDHRAVVTLC